MNTEDKSEAKPEPPRTRNEILRDFNNPDLTARQCGELYRELHSAGVRPVPERVENRAGKSNRPQERGIAAEDKSKASESGGPDERAEFEKWLKQLGFPAGVDYSWQNAALAGWTARAELREGWSRMRCAICRSELRQYWVHVKSPKQPHAPVLQDSNTVVKP